MVLTITENLRGKLSLISTLPYGKYLASHLPVWMPVKEDEQGIQTSSEAIAHLQLLIALDFCLSSLEKEAPWKETNYQRLPARIRR